MILKSQVSLELVYFLILVSIAGSGSTSESVSIRVGETVAFVEVAETRDQRRIGLMNHRSLTPDGGMLFIYQEEKVLSFWMKNTLLALDIGFFDRDGVLLSYTSMQPIDDKTIHRSRKPALYALEISQGWFKSNKISIGAKLRMKKN